MDDLANAMDQVFGGSEAAPAADVPAVQPEPAPDPAPPAEAAPAPALDPQPAPQPETKPEEHTVPLAKFLDQRDELRELRRFKQEQEAKAARPAAPEPFDDQEKGFVSAEVAKVRFEMSDVMARQTHGAEKVDAANEWAMQRAQQDPVFAAQYMRETHPIDWIVRQHQRENLLSQIGDNPDDWIRRKAAEMGLLAPQPTPQPAAVVPQPAPTPAAPRPSLIGAPSGGGVEHVPAGPLAAVDAVFPR